jgi:diguanylate cyclase (GGDEF)-like protein
MKDERLRSFRRASSMFAVFTGIFVACLVVQPGGAIAVAWVDDLGELVAAAIAGIVCLVVSSRDPRARRVWLLMGASALSWAAGEAVYSWYELIRGIETPFPSFADVGFLGAVPFSLVAIFLFPSAPVSVMGRLRMGLDGLIVAGSLLFASWATVLGPAYHGGGSPFTKVVSLAYPVSDVVMVTVVVIVLSRAVGPRRPTLALLAAGLVFMAVSDSAFAYLTQTGTFGHGNVTDSGWVAGYLLVALAALYPGPARSLEEAKSKDGSKVQEWLPYLPVAGAVVVAIVEAMDKGELDGFLVTDVIALLAAMVVCQVLTISQNAALARSLETAVSELQSHERQLEHKTFHDPLTGLPNRVLFRDRVDHALSRQARHDRSVAILFCDLDDFKAVNDTFGHSVGDELLVAVADRLRTCARAEDTLARLGGDEFAVLADEIDVTDGTSTAEAIAARMIEAMGDPFIVMSKEIVTHFSIGVALSSPPGTDAESLIRNADAALYQAKAVGRNCVAVFNEKLEQEARYRFGIESGLRRAIEGGELRVHYQPIVSVSTGKMVSVEALVRWAHPELGLLQPDAFVHLAEVGGFIAPVGAWVLEESCRQLRAWQDVCTEPITLAVNASARQLRSSSFVGLVADILDRTGVDPACLCLEITESVLIDDTGIPGQVLAAVRALGARVAIDDFGTGYSPLTYLRHYPIDELKIDKSFVAKLGTETEATAIVTAVTHLARALDLTTVAEGVESGDQWAQLQLIGCELAQGFYWSGPVPADELGSWLELDVPGRALTRMAPAPG